MKNNTHRIAKEIERDIWAVLGDKPIGNGFYRQDDGQVLSIKDEMNPDLKLIYTYYRNRNQIRDNVIRPLKNIVSLLPEYKSGARDIHVPVYKMTIKVNRRQLHVYKHHLLTSDGTLAVDVLHTRLQKLRHNLSRNHSEYRIKGNYPHITYKGGLHSHGAIFGHISQKQVVKMTKYLNKTAPFDIYVKVSPLQANTCHEQVTLGNHDCNNDLSAVQQWLTYSHRSGKLAFPSTKHPEHYLNEWRQLSEQGKYNYVQTCFKSLDGSHHHYNYTYSFNKELNTMIATILAFLAARHSEASHELRVTRQAQAIADDKVMPHLHNAWLNHKNSKHLTSLEKFNLARGKKPELASQGKYTQIDIFSSSKPSKDNEPSLQYIVHTLKEALAVEPRTQKAVTSNEASNGIKQDKPINNITTVTASRIVNHSGIPP